MAKIIETMFKEIVPGNIGILPRHIKTVADRVRRGECLFPVATRRSEVYPDRYTTLDIGNSRIIYSIMSGVLQIPIFLADSKDDLIPRDMFLSVHKNSLYNANHSIAIRWDECEKVAKTSGFENYTSYFERLVQKYPQFKSVPEFLKHYQSLYADFDNPRRIGTLQDLN